MTGVRIRISIVILLAVIWMFGPVWLVEGGSVEEDRQEAQAHNNRGAELARNERYLEAVEAFRKAVRFAPDFLVAHFNLGLAYSRLQDFEKAQEALETAARLRPDNGDVWFHLGRVLQAREKYGEATGAYRVALQLKPGDPDVRYWLGIVSWLQNNWAEAAAQWEALITQYPDHGSVPKVWKDLPRAYYNMGTAHQEAGRLDEATKAYRDAVRLRPDYPEALANLGAVYRDQGKMEEAVEAFQQALKLNPEDTGALTGLGSVYVKQDRLDLAVAQFQRALHFRPASLEVRNALVHAYLQQGNVSAARQEVLQVLEQAPNDPGSYRLLAYVCEHNDQGVRYGEGYRSDDALQAYAQALQLEPKNAILYLNMGVLFGRAENWIHARAAFLKALEVDSTYAEARRLLSIVEANMIQPLQLKVVAPESVKESER